MSTPEGAILKAICQYLSILESQGKLVYWRQNNGATYDPRRGIYRKPNGAGYKAGVPDLCVILGGRYIGLEVKSATGTQKPEQKALQKLLEGVGAMYVVVRSVDDVASLFSSLPSLGTHPALSLGL